MTPGPAGRASWAEHICHPLPLGAVAVLAANDQLLKGSGLLPPAVTGKLSDVAGLFFFPLLVSAAVRGCRRLIYQHEGDHPLIALAAVISTGLIFAGLKTVPWFNHVVSTVLGPNTLDPTDMWALFALVPSWLWMRRSTHLHLPDRLHFAAVVASAVASLATSRIPGHYVRNFPAWTIEDPHPREIDCGSIEAWVLKSGKQGAGIVLEVTANAEECEVEVRDAQFVLPGESVKMATPPATIRAERGGPKDMYLPFLFDGDAAWNRDDTRATLHLALLVRGAPTSWDLHLTEKLDGELYVFRPDHPRP